METIQKATTKQYSHGELYDALIFAQDALERSAIPFIALGEFARCLYEGVNDDLLTMDKIEYGIKQSEAQKDGLSMLNTLLDERNEVTNKILNDKSIQFHYNDVPVYFKIIKRDYDFINNPDSRIYYVSEFKFPNPFQKYWKVRFLVQ